jgi:hypothetical protein
VTTLTIEAPVRSLAQRHDALQKANEVREKRAALKRDLKAGRDRTVDVLADPPWWVETMKITDLLLATPKVGRTKAHKMLRRAHVSPTRSVGGLSDRQREELVAMLGGYGWRP